jgi:hypothetical protein
MTDPDRKLLLEWIAFSIEMGERIGDLTQAFDKHLRGEDDKGAESGRRGEPKLPHPMTEEVCARP